MKQIIINGISIELEKKKIKNMYIRILPPDGRVHVSAPQRMNENYIKDFILSKMEWIKLQQLRMRQRSIRPLPEYVTGEEVYVLGEKYYLTVNNNSSRNMVVRKDGQIFLNVKDNSTISQREKVLKDWYRILLTEQLPLLIAKWESIIGVKAGGFCIRDMKTRWGTCNIRSHNICFNLQLARKPLRCVEYVVVHELVHLLEKSHNNIFKGYMDQYLPQWRIIRKELNENIS